VLTVDRDIVDELSKEAEPFRSTTLISFDRGDVAAVDARIGESAYVLTHESGGWASAGRPVLAAAADDVLQTLADIRSRAFVDEAAAKTLPPATATVAIKTRTKTSPAWTVAFHPRATDAVARVSGRPGGFAVARDTVDGLQAALQKAVTAPTPAPTK
jgi:hypothetical protein